MRKYRFCAATAIGLAMAMPATAQDNTGQDNNEAAEEEIDFITGTGGYDEGIIVTAQGRQENVQDVPIAITVVDNELVENSGIDDVRGLRQLTSSLQATTGQSSATGVVLSIRGIGTAGDNPGFEPAVGVFVDGVFRARAGLALSDFPELDRIEVLRGPQGTLFGRNTSAGAISITTAGPKFVPSGYAELSYGNFNELNIKGGVTAPVNSTVALRVDGGYHKRDGYIYDVNNDQNINNIDRYFARGQALFDGENIRFRLIADMAETNELCCGAITTAQGLTGPIVNGLAALAGQTGFTTFDEDDYRVAYSPGRDLTENVKEWGISGQFDIDIGDMTLTSITAYRDWDAERGQDVDFSGLDRAYREGYMTGITDFTQEVRLSGEAFGGKLDWLVGGFYLNEQLYVDDRIRVGTQSNLYTDSVVRALSASAQLPTGFQIFGSLGPTVPTFGEVILGQAIQQGNTAITGNPAIVNFLLTPPPGAPAGSGQVSDYFQVDTEAFALFTHNIFDVTDKLRLTLGLRYNHENKDISADLNSVFAPCDYLLNPANALYTQQLIAAAPSALLLTCNPTINTEFNGTYADGRSEDEITGTAKLAYDFSDRALGFLSYAHGYKSGGYNLDRGTFDTVLLGGNGAQLTDLEFGKETVNSYEVGLKTNPTPQLQFNLTGFYQDFAGYQNLRFEGTSFVVRQYAKVISKGLEAELGWQPFDDVNFQLAYTHVSAVVDDPVNAADDQGLQITNQPKNVVTGAVTYTPQITDSVGGLLHVDFRTMSKSNTLNDPAGIPFTYNPGYTSWNARVGVELMDGIIGIEAFTENAFDQYYNITSFPIPEQVGAYAVYPSVPRTYGIRIRAGI